MAEAALETEVQECKGNDPSEPDDGHRRAKLWAVLHERAECEDEHDQEGQTTSCRTGLRVTRNQRMSAVWKSTVE